MKKPRLAPHKYKSADDLNALAKRVVLAAAALNKAIDAAQDQGLDVHAVVALDVEASLTPRWSVDGVVKRGGLLTSMSVKAPIQFMSDITLTGRRLRHVSK